MQTTVPAKKVFRDNSGNLWGGNGTQSAIVTVSQVYGGFKIGLNYLGRYGSNKVSTANGCPSSSDYCCTNSLGQSVTFAMSRNDSAPLYDVFVAADITNVFQNMFIVSIGNDSFILYLDQDTTFAQWPSNKRGNPARASSPFSLNAAVQHFVDAHREELGLVLQEKALQASEDSIEWSEDEIISELKRASSSRDKDHTRANLQSTYVEKKDNGGAFITATAEPMAWSAFTQVRGGEYIAVPVLAAQKPFIMPASAFSGNQPGTPGYTKAAFASGMRGLCSLSSAQALVYYQGNPANTDSFLPYNTSSNQIGNTPYAVSLSLSSLDPTYAPNNWVFVTTSLQISSLASLTIDSTDYTLIRVYADPEITNTGTFLSIGTPSTSDSVVVAESPAALSGAQSDGNSFNVYVDVANKGRVDGLVTMAPIKCCTSPIGPDGVILTSATYNGTMSCSQWFIASTTATLSSGGAQRLIVSMPYIPYGQSGFCSFNITATGNPDSIYTEVGVLIYPLETSPTPTSPNSAPPSTCSASSPDPGNCISPCKLDQMWKNTTAAEYISITPAYAPSSSTSSDPSTAPENIVSLKDGTICVPVDCITKYKGSRNVYDPSTGLCKPYGSTTTPIAPSASPDLVIVTPIGPPSSSPTAPISNVSPSISTQSCGAHGKWNSFTGMCDCDNGWITAPGQLAENYEFCNAVGSNDLSLVGTPSGKTRDPWLLPVLITLGIVIVIGVILVLLRKCIARCCCKSSSKDDDKKDLEKGKSKRKKRQRRDSKGSKIGVKMDTKSSPSAAAVDPASSSTSTSDSDSASIASPAASSSFSSSSQADSTGTSDAGSSSTSRT